MKIIFARTTVDFLNNMTAVEAEALGVSPAFVKHLTDMPEITGLKHIRMERIGENWECEVSDELILKTAHLYARVARIMVPPVMAIVKAFKALTCLDAHNEEIEQMLLEPSDEVIDKIESEASIYAAEMVGPNSHEYDSVQQKRVDDQIAHLEALRDAKRRSATTH